MMVLSTIWRVSAWSLGWWCGGAAVYLLQLLVLQVASDHHLQHDKELAIANVSVAVDVVYAEGKAQLLLLVALAAEGTQARDELLEVDVTAAILVEDGNHAGCERVGGDLGECEELVAVDGARVVLVELHEALAQTVHLIAVDCEDRLAAAAAAAASVGVGRVQHTVGPRGDVVEDG